MLEPQIQSKILKKLSEWPDLFCFKTIVTNKRGVPDIICCYKGKFIAFEVKRDGKQKASELQLYQIQKIEGADGLAYVVSSVEEVEYILSCI